MNFLEQQGRNIFMQLGSKLKPVRLDEMYERQRNSPRLQNKIPHQKSQSQTQSTKFNQTYGRFSSTFNSSQMSYKEPLSIIGSKKRVTNA